MRIRKKSVSQALLLLAALSLVPATAAAKDREFDVIGNHIKTHYRGQRRRIPFLGLANLVVKIARPAGVKSFKVAIFENLSFAPHTGGTGIDTVMRNALSTEWQPLVRVRARSGEQNCVFSKQAGKNIKLMIVSIQHDQAVVLRVKFDPQALAKWLEKPELMGISLTSQTAGGT